jgi:hypothetical protein
MCNPDIAVGDLVENKTTGAIYIKTTEIIPELCSSLMIEGVKGHTYPYNYKLDSKSKLSNSNYITLLDIPVFEKQIDKITTDFENMQYRKTVAYTKSSSNISKIASIGTDPLVVKGYTDFLNSYDLKVVNIISLYNIIINTNNKVGQFKWLIDLGNFCIENKTNTFTKNDGITGDITLTFPLSSYDYVKLENNLPSNSNFYISSDLTKPQSFNYHIKKFYEEVVNFDVYLQTLTENNREMESLYNDFIIKNDLADKIYYGVFRPYNFPGKGTIRVGDAKAYISFSNPHKEITNEIINNPALNIFHGDVYYNNSEQNESVKMYLRLLGSTLNTYTYEWVTIGTTVPIVRDINNDPIYEEINLDPATFYNLDKKTTTYTSSDGILPSLNWNIYKSWLNIGDIWLDSSNIALGIVQKVFSNNGTIFEWVPLQSNNAPLLSPFVVNTDEDIAVSGNMLNGVFDMENDTFFLKSVKIGGNTYNTNVNVTSVDILITGVGTLKLFGNDGTYYFSPLLNIYTSTSFSYTVEDSKGATSTSIWTIYIKPVNDRPTVSGPISKVYSSSITTSQNINLTQNTVDVESDTIAVDDIVCETNNSQSFSPYRKVDEIISLTPSYYKEILKRDSTVEVHFTYSVTDGYSPKTYTAASVTITGINHAPIISSDIVVNVLTTGSVTNINLLQNATDFDDDTLVIDNNDFNHTGDISGITYSNNILSLTPSVYNSILTNTGDYLDITYTYYVLDEVNVRSNMGTLNIRVTKS